jgi:signal transduction histidine kinase
MPIDKKWESYATCREFDTGETIFREGDPGEEMYIVKKGQLVITKETGGGEEIILGYRGEGELIGEISIISDAPRSASAAAMEPMELFTIGREDFWRILREDVDFQRMVMETLIESLLDADRFLVTATDSERDLFERFSSLSSEHDRIAELMRLRKETIHFIVHDLRNPLNLVSMALSLIRATPGYDSEGQMGRFVAMANGGVQRMLALVDALLDVERLEGGGVILDLEAVDMNKLAQEVLSRIEPMAWSGEVDIELALSGEELPIVQMDRHRIDRVITNLADNALKFTPSGGTITVGIVPIEEGVQVSINDTGPGIPEDQRDRIFDRFTQTEEGRKAKGFGLGLAFCRSAVMAHGGQIWVEEGDNGKGTKFVFTLPEQPPAAE